MLQTKQLIKKFKTREVLHSIDVEFGPGVYGFLGPNGAGKTTFIRCVLGLYHYGGQVLWDGEPVSKENDIAAHLGYLPQKFSMYKELKLYQAMDYIAAVKKIPASESPAEIKRCLELVNLTDRMYDRVGSLSGGMVRRFGIAQALLGDPRIVIVDEPTAGLDPEERMRFKNVINKIKKDKIVIISTHIIEDVEALCDKIVIIHLGNIINIGSIEQTAKLAQGKVFEVDTTAQYDPEQVFILKSYERDGKTLQRLLTHSPADGFMSVEPTVEDGYMSAIKDFGD